MKTTRFTILTILTFMTILWGPDTFAQDSPQYNLPTGAIASFGKGRVIEMAYSSDGTRLAVATQTGVWIHDAQTREELDMLAGHPEGISDIAYSPDGRVLACATGDEVWLWDTVSGQLNTSLTGRGNNVAFSPDGTTLATESWEEIRLWDVASRQLKTTLTGHTGWLRSVAFSPDGTTLASGSWESTVYVWDVASRQLKTTLTGHAGPVLSIMFSPDGTTLASGGSLDRTVRLWDVASGQLKTMLTGHTGWVESVTFSPDGTTLASGGSWESTVRLWDVASGQLKTMLTGHTGWVESVTFSPDGTTLASSSNEIHLWDVASGQLSVTLTGYTGWVESVAFSPDSSTLASSSANKVHLWDVATGQSKATLSHTGDVRSVAFSPDGKTIASGGSSGIYLWDVATEQSKTTLIYTGDVRSVAFSPDGKTIASGGSSGIYLWDVATEQSKTTLIYTGDVRSVAFSPDGKTIASGGSGIYLWDVVSGQHKASLAGGTERTESVAFSPDGRTLATSGGREIRLWEADTGQHKATIKGKWEQGSIVFSPDGQTLTSQVALWDAVSGHQKSTFPKQSNSVLSVAFSPDGTTLASGNRGGVVFLWELTPAISQPRHPMVRLIYFRPSDHTPLPNIDLTLDTLIKETQEFFAEQMENHGFGRKTFTFETDASGTAVVHHIEGQLTAADYLNEYTFKITEELEQLPLFSDNHIYLVALDVSLEGMLSFFGRCGTAHTTRSAFNDDAFQQRLGGFAIIPVAGECFNVGVAAHEIGHTAGLSHDFRNDAYLMSYGTQDRLSYWAAQWLDVHPCWNPGQSRSNTLTTIEVLSTRASRLRFHVTDVDGLQQVQLIELTVPTSVCGFRETLQDSQVLEGRTSDIFKFAVPSSIREGALKVMDTHGSIAVEYFSITPDETTVTDADMSMDVNGDGVLNNADVTFIVSRLEQPGQGNPADVNGDGLIDAADIVLVAGALVEAAAAPSTYPQVMETFTATDIQQWLTQAQQLNLTDATSQRGIRFLQHLLTMMIPKETALLPNYPNPFNPETWIPYQLAAPANVTVSIYAADGKLIRTLALGQLPAGRYENQSHAAYWDGKNEFDESVASGIYFYTLTAGDVTTTTRKMLIRK